MVCRLQRAALLWELAWPSISQERKDLLVLAGSCCKRSRIRDPWRDWLRRAGLLLLIRSVIRGSRIKNLPNLCGI
uniref:Uncharacterized protein n=1 Tax=Arundo donax TaxID=35708 RepID=A0A0A9DZ77_ARUDO